MSLLPSCTRSPGEGLGRCARPSSALSVAPPHCRSHAPGGRSAAVLLRALLGRRCRRSSIRKGLGFLFELYATLLGPRVLLARRPMVAAGAKPPSNPGQPRSPITPTRKPTQGLTLPTSASSCGKTPNAAIGELVPGCVGDAAVQPPPRPPRRALRRRHDRVLPFDDVAALIERAPRRACLRLSDGADVRLEDLAVRDTDPGEELERVHGVAGIRAGLGRAPRRVRPLGCAGTLRVVRRQRLRRGMTTSPVVGSSFDAVGASVGPVGYCQ